MYRCQKCGIVVPAGTPCQRMVVQTRTVAFPFRSRANRVVRLVNCKAKEKYTDDPGGKGPQVLREVNLCPACANGQARAGK